jgi:hypothetical protein
MPGDPPEGFDLRGLDPAHLRELADLVEADGWAHAPHRHSVWEQNNERLAERSDPATNEAWDRLTGDVWGDSDDSEIADETDDGSRTVTLIPASTFRMRPVHWLWDGRIPLGALTLNAGREGIGKSVVAYQLAADLTRGRLSGCLSGTPKSVLVAATEDSWSYTIVPRLVAAGADLERVYRVQVREAGWLSEITMPADLAGVERLGQRVDAALLILDPLLSRLSGKLDTHADAEVRQALEPLAALADRSRLSVVGLIHVNKSLAPDVLTSVMASRAFVAVARTVLFVAADPDDETRLVIGLARTISAARTCPAWCSVSTKCRWPTPTRVRSRPESSPGKAKTSGRYRTLSTPPRLPVRTLRRSPPPPDGSPTI